MTLVSPLTLPFHYYQLLLGRGRHPLPYSSMGLHGFLVIPKLKSGLFFFQKVLYELVFGTGNEDSYGNDIKNNASVLRAAHKAERRQSF